MPSLQHFQDGRRAQQHIESSWKQLESVSISHLSHTHLSTWPRWGHGFRFVLFYFRVNAGLNATARRPSELDTSLTESTWRTRRTEKRFGSCKTIALVKELILQKEQKPIKMYFLSLFLSVCLSVSQRCSLKVSSINFTGEPCFLKKKIWPNFPLLFKKRCLQKANRMI